MFEELFKLGLSKERLVDTLNYMQAAKAAKAQVVSERKPLKDKIRGRFLYIKAVFEQTDDSRKDKEGNPIIRKYPTTGPAILEELFVASDKENATKFIKRFPRKAKQAVTREDLKERLWQIMCRFRERDPKAPILGLKAFPKKGYRIIRRVIGAGGKVVRYEPV